MTITTHEARATRPATFGLVCIQVVTVYVLEDVCCSVENLVSWLGGLSPEVPVRKTFPGLGNEIYSMG